jgi:hypothetical protein
VRSPRAQRTSTASSEGTTEGVSTTAG